MEKQRSLNRRMPKGFRGGLWFTGVAHWVFKWGEGCERRVSKWVIISCIRPHQRPVDCRANSQSRTNPLSCKCVIHGFEIRSTPPFPWGPEPVPPLNPTTLHSNSKSVPCPRISSQEMYRKICTKEFQEITRKIYRKKIQCPWTIYFDSVVWSYQKRICSRTPTTTRQNRVKIYRFFEKLAPEVSSPPGKVVESYQRFQVSTIFPSKMSLRKVSGGPLSYRSCHPRKFILQPKLRGENFPGKVCNFSFSPLIFVLRNNNFDLFSYLNIFNHWFYFFGILLLLLLLYIIISFYIFLIKFSYYIYIIYMYMECISHTFCPALRVRKTSRERYAIFFVLRNHIFDFSLILIYFITIHFVPHYAWQ